MPHHDLDPRVRTGALLTLTDPAAPADHVMARLETAAGCAFTRVGKGRSAALPRALRQRDSLFLETLGIAVLEAPDEARSETMAALAEDRDSGILAVRPEFFVFADAMPPADWAGRYRTWLREGAELLANAPEGALPHMPGPAPDPGAPAPAPGGTLTWGLSAIGGGRTSLTGRGVRVAIVDTGIVRDHPAFAGRGIDAVSFVPSENADDRHGHGTHCFGTALGGAPTEDGLRYGIAGGACALSAKCLDATGVGRESWIIAGIDWALERGAEIVSLSLGLPVPPGGDLIYTRLGEAALGANALLIAASGNGSDRPGRVEPAMLPAAASSVLAVGALNEALGVAPFSNGAVAGPGREIDILAPGVNVFSTHLPPLAYRRLSGTSMAAPHVAGVAALLAESDAALRGRALWEALVASGRDLGLGADAAPLLQAPGGAMGAG